MRGLRYLIALLLSMALITGAAVSAQASPVFANGDPAAAIESLAVGQVLILDTAVITRTEQGLVVEPLQTKQIEPSTDATFCGTALAAAIFGIGAGVLGFIAAGTGGTGTVLLAGYVFTGAQVGMMAAVAGSYAALLAWISRYVC